MNIEISGVFPANRGALLMLEAIRAQVHEVFPKARLVVPLDWSATDRLRYSVWGTSGALPKDLSLRLLERAPWKVREYATFVRSRDIDVLLDASGFGYGDFWGLEKLRNRLADRLNSWKTPGKKAVLLPQALGPFQDKGMAKAFVEAAEQLDLIYVRDAVSMEFVEALLPGNAQVRRAPDFTNLLQPELPRRLENLRGAAYIIPNEKMVSGKGDAIRARYLAFLADAVGAIRASGRKATLLLHEGRNDFRLAEALNANLETSVDIVNEPDALVTKALIGAAEFIVSSRFHGLVSALSAGVPALACGWSHKYRELMADYGCAEAMVDLERDETPRSTLEAFVERVGDSGYREGIARHSAEQKALSKAMWGEVFDLMRAN